MTRIVFYGFGAYVGSISGPTTCSWWSQDPSGSIAWDPKQQVTVDLAHTPQGVRRGALVAAAVKVDDPPHHGGLTRIGPVFPSGQMIGACWLEKTFWEGLAKQGLYQPPRLTPHDQCRDYELTSVVDLATNRRFCGFHAQIASTQGTLALCTIWHAGTSLVPNQQPAGSWWIDLATAADAPANGFTTVAKQGDVGALFLDVPTIQTLRLEGPKRPVVLGRVPYFSSTEE